jgi:hypothetical protein
MVENNFFLSRIIKLIIGSSPKYASIIFSDYYFNIHENKTVRIYLRFLDHHINANEGNLN